VEPVHNQKPTRRLLLGLAATLLVVAVFSFYSLRQIQGLRTLQTQTIDRNRRDSLQLLRIQNDLNSLAIAMRDMVDRQEGYPLEAWRGEFERIRYDLDDAVRIESSLATRSHEQQKYLSELLRQFWISADQIFTIAQQGEETRALAMISNSLQAQQASLSSNVARLLVQNHEAEEQASTEIQTIYARVALNLKIFIVAMVVAIAAVMLAVIAANRRIFNRLATVSEQRSTLARRLIGIQEEVFRSVARELHDDFGQILTAVGVMLLRAEKKHLPAGSALQQDMTEIRQVVQETIEKTRSFSQALHPTILDDYGLEKAIQRYVETFERQTGLGVRYEKEGAGSVPDEKGIHVYRVLQEALTNVARHSRASHVWVRVRFNPEQFRLEVQDDGVGSGAPAGKGLGMIAMEERAELLRGRLAVVPSLNGTLVSLEVPLGIDGS
jgi:signal transduction histidine kinase